MPDTPANTSTTLTVTVDGAAVSDVLEVNGDHDWFAVTLVAGQTYTFLTQSTTGTNNTSTDTTLALRDAAGHLIAFNDDYDNPPGQFSRITFTATTSGTYYLDVGGYNDADTGGYQVRAFTAAPLALPVYDNDEIALQLTDGFWGNDPHHLDVAPGGTLTVHISALTAAGQTLARAALALWSDATGITFSEVPNGPGADIDFTDNQVGAFTSTEWTDGIITSAVVNVGTGWISTYGTGLNTYSMQTYVHEIGHALGLGHGGDYNGSATYPADAIYANDGWPATIMSYFDGRNENDWFSGQGFTSQYTIAPMAADIIAVNNLYGARVGLTRTGDTTYGFNNSSGRDVFSATAVNGAAVTIVDDGGIDTLDYSLTSASQQIWLTSELFSNVLGRTGNLVIARGTVIENVLGGSGSDIIVGNAANNVLNGGAGADILYGEDGDDTLDGGSGNDEIDGGQGADTILASAGNDSYRGGAGGDVFVFGPVLAFLDTPVIADLDGADLIDMNTRPGDAVQITTFIGTTAFGHVAGEYRYFWSGGTTVVEYDGDGDGVADGSLTIANGEFGLQQFTSGSGAHNLQIAGGGSSNTPPVAADDSATTDQDTPLTIDVKANDSDADGDPLTVSLIASWTAQGGSVAVDGANMVSYTPASGFSGTDTFTYSISDGQGGSATATVTVTVNPVANVIMGTPNPDTLNGTNGVDQIYGLGSADVLNGRGGNDLLDGGNGDDTLDGGAGDDVMRGGFGNDRYYVDSAGDTVEENAGQGNDLVIATADWTLGANVEDLRLSGGATTGTGNELDNEISASGAAGGVTILGLGGADYLRGSLHDDVIDGGDGNDRIFGDEGNNTLSGGLGRDSIVGGSGVDTIDGGEGNDVL
ncbi:MAG: M10 family metallopeptidase C-terminal domain-containing protein, partial [Erythrobacter sp.]|nr:M10 family metallopeptidase C-terminal domain-containing protein [Erythrobacter sp.]